MLEQPVRRTPVRYETEVLVVGGGSAGVAAAVAAARNGAEVMLVERYGYLGGLATGGLIILLLTLDDGRGRQAVRAAIVIDATGDGDILTSAGCAHKNERVLRWLWFTVVAFAPAPYRTSAGRLENQCGWGGSPNGADTPGLMAEPSLAGAA